eukprot:2122554-Pyramimonas_sp.AAC.1
MLHSNTIDMKREITTQVSAQVAPLASSVQEIREVQESQAKQIRDIQLQMSAQSKASEGGSLAGESARASAHRDFRGLIEAHVPTWIQISGFCKDDPRKIENRDKAKLP